MDVERTTTVGKPADAMFAILADPGRIAAWVPLVSHVDTEVEDGEAPEAEAPAEHGLGVIPFVPDAASRRISWGDPDAAYHGSITVAAGTTSTSDVTIRLHVHDDLDRVQVEAFLEQAVRGIRRLALTG